MSLIYIIGTNFAVRSITPDSEPLIYSSPAVIVTDQEYPLRPAFSLLTKLLDEFTAKVPNSSFPNPSSISFPEITSYIEKYQDPRQADTIMKVQQELDETKIILVSLADPRIYIKRKRKTEKSHLNDC
jgi:hypothetical protein